MTERELIEYIKKHFVYHEDGSITRSDRKDSNGSRDKDGYIILKIKGRQYKAHRIVYALHNNEMPAGELDHINRVRDDNRIENLRVVTRRQNILNTSRKINKETGVIGVHFDRTKGLKKNFATKLGSKTWRFYTVEEAENKRREYYANQEEFIKHD